MTRKKILLALLAVIVISQIPFAYRRYRLSKLNRAIQQLAAQRAAPSADVDYVDYAGVIHVHSSLGGHSTGNFAELIAAAKTGKVGDGKICVVDLEQVVRIRTGERDSSAI